MLILAILFCFSLPACSSENSSVFIKARLTILRSFFMKNHSIFFLLDVYASSIQPSYIYQFFSYGDIQSSDRNYITKLTTSLSMSSSATTQPPSNHFGNEEICNNVARNDEPVPDDENNALQTCTLQNSKCNTCLDEWTARRLEETENASLVASAGQPHSPTFTNLRPCPSMFDGVHCQAPSTLSGRVESPSTRSICKSTATGSHIGTDTQAKRAVEIQTTADIQNMLNFKSVHHATASHPSSYAQSNIPPSDVHQLIQHAPCTKPCYRSCHPSHTAHVKATHTSTRQQIAIDVCPFTLSKNNSPPGDLPVLPALPTVCRTDDGPVAEAGPVPCTVLQSNTPRLDHCSEAAGPPNNEPTVVANIATKSLSKHRRPKNHTPDDGPSAVADELLADPAFTNSIRDDQKFQNPSYDSSARFSQLHRLNPVSELNSVIVSASLKAARTSRPVIKSRTGNGAVATNIRSGLGSSDSTPKTLQGHRPNLVKDPDDTEATEATVPSELKKIARKPVHAPGRKKAVFTKTRSGPNVIDTIPKISELIEIKSKKLSRLNFDKKSDAVVASVAKPPVARKGKAIPKNRPELKSINPRAKNSKLCRLNTEKDSDAVVETVSPKWNQSAQQVANSLHRNNIDSRINCSDLTSVAVAKTVSPDRNQSTQQAANSGIVKDTAFSKSCPGSNLIHTSAEIPDLCQLKPVSDPDVVDETVSSKLNGVAGKAEKSHTIRGAIVTKTTSKFNQMCAAEKTAENNMKNSVQSLRQESGNISIPPLNPNSTPICGQGSIDVDTNTGTKGTVSLVRVQLNTNAEWPNEGCSVKTVPIARQASIERKRKGPAVDAPCLKRTKTTKVAKAIRSTKNVALTGAGNGNSGNRKKATLKEKGSINESMNLPGKFRRGRPLMMGPPQGHSLSTQSDGTYKEMGEIWNPPCLQPLRGGPQGAVPKYAKTVEMCSKERVYSSYIAEVNGGDCTEDFARVMKCASAPQTEVATIHRREEILKANEATKTNLENSNLNYEELHSLCKDLRKENETLRLGVLSKVLHVFETSCSARGISQGAFTQSPEAQRLDAMSNLSGALRALETVEIANKLNMRRVSADDVYKAWIADLTRVEDWGIESVEHMMELVRRQIVVGTPLDSKVRHDFKKACCGIASQLFTHSDSDSTQEKKSVTPLLLGTESKLQKLLRTFFESNSDLLWSNVIFTDVLRSLFLPIVENRTRPQSSERTQETRIDGWHAQPGCTHNGAQLILKTMTVCSRKAQKSRERGRPVDMLCKRNVREICRRIAASAGCMVTLSQLNVDKYNSKQACKAVDDQSTARETLLFSNDYLSMRFERLVARNRSG